MRRWARKLYKDTPITPGEVLEVLHTLTDSPIDPIPPMVSYAKGLSQWEYKVWAEHRFKHSGIESTIIQGRSYPQYLAQILVMALEMAGASTHGED